MLQLIHYFNPFIALIKKGQLARKFSIDLLEGLDFDFMSVNKVPDAFIGGNSYSFDVENDFFFDNPNFQSETDDILALEQIKSFRSNSEILDFLVDDKEIFKKLPSKKGFIFIYYFY